jgi:hypothetical protein
MVGCRNRGHYGQRTATDGGGQRESKLIPFYIHCDFSLVRILRIDRKSQGAA